MSDAIRKTVLWVTAAAALALTACAGNAGQPVEIARAPEPAQLIAQQIVNQERRCTYKGKGSAYYIALGVAESCPTQHAFLGEQWDRAAKRF